MTFSELKFSGEWIVIKIELLVYQGIKMYRKFQPKTRVQYNKFLLYEFVNTGNAQFQSIF